MTVTTETEVEQLLDERRWTGKIFSDGWADAPTVIETIEPATGDVLGQAGGGDPDTIASAAESAAAAEREWAETPFTDRVAIVKRAAELMERHRPELQTWLVRESGSIPGKADVEISASIGQLDMAAALVSHPNWLGLPSLTPGRTSKARRVPLGRVGLLVALPGQHHHIV